jgi:hypothetical protein
MPDPVTADAFPSKLEQGIASTKRDHQQETK